MAQSCLELLGILLPRLQSVGIIGSHQLPDLSTGITNACPCLAQVLVRAQQTSLPGAEPPFVILVGFFLGLALLLSLRKMEK